MKHPKKPTARRVKVNPPDIKKAWLYRMWFESKYGKRLALDPNDAGRLVFPPVKKYPYAYTRFPLKIVTSVYRRRKDGAYGANERIFCESRGVAADLVIELVEREKMKLGDALIVASIACERCQNILAHKYGMCWGYPATSKLAKACSASCELCR